MELLSPSYAHPIWLMHFFFFNDPSYKNPEHQQATGYPAEKCRRDNCRHWFLRARSIMSDGTEAFRGLSQNRVGPLNTLSGRQALRSENYCTDRPRPDKSESICALAFLSVGSLWHLQPAVLRGRASSFMFIDRELSSHWKELEWRFWLPLHE